MADAKSHASIKVDSGTDGIIRFQYIAFLFPAPPKAEAKRGMQRRRNNRKCKRGRLQYNAVMTLSAYFYIAFLFPAPPEGRGQAGHAEKEDS